jgi:hypothetical protein
LNGISEISVEGIHVAAIPSDFNGVTDGALHAAGSGLILLCYGRVEDLCYRVDDVAILE